MTLALHAMEVHDHDRGLQEGGDIQNSSGAFVLCLCSAHCDTTTLTSAMLTRETRTSMPPPKQKTKNNKHASIVLSAECFLQPSTSQCCVQWGHITEQRFLLYQCSPNLWQWIQMERTQCTTIRPTRLSNLSPLWSYGNSEKVKVTVSAATRAQSVLLACADE